MSMTPKLERPHTAYLKHGRPSTPQKDSLLFHEYVPGDQSPHAHRQLGQPAKRAAEAEAVRTHPSYSMWAAQAVRADAQ